MIKNKLNKDVYKGWFRKKKYCVAINAMHHNIYVAHLQFCNLVTKQKKLYCIETLIQFKKKNIQKNWKWTILFNYS